MFSQRIEEKEIIDDLEFSSPALIENLRDMDFINHWLGYNRILIAGINKVRKKYKTIWKKGRVVIADLGCGSGDALRCVQDWARKEKHDCEFIGIDGNAFVIDHAARESSLHPEIKYCVMDILDERLFEENCKQQFDVVTLNNICHHFRDKEIIKLIEHLCKHTRLAIIINDLHRHSFAYWGIKVLDKLCNFSNLTKHDGPLSVCKGFKKSDIENILTATGSKSFEIRWTWPFRWQVIIWCEANLG